MKRTLLGLTSVAMLYAATSLSGVSPVSTAHAADNWGTLPAYACRANNKVSQNDLSYGTSRVFNNNFTKTRFIVCAAIKDYDVVDATDNGSLYARLQLAPGTSGKCTGYYNYRWGTVQDSWVTNFANASGAYVETGVNMFPDSPSGNYYYPSIVCDLPPRSGIRFTRINEDYDTGTVSTTTDEHDVGGFKCRAATEALQENLSYGRARVVNNGDTNLAAYCWHIQDADANNTLDAAASIDVYVHVAVPAGATVTCRAGKRDTSDDGLALMDSDTESYTNATAGTVNRMYTLAYNGGGALNDSFNHSYLNCNLPAGAAIYDIHVWEDTSS